MNNRLLDYVPAMTNPAAPALSTGTADSGTGRGAIDHLGVSAAHAPPIAGSPPASGPRGGRRPGAGARPGNLNALRHGRRSRFADQLVSAGDAVTLAHRLLARQRRALERQAATVLEFALMAQHERALAHALETGSPPPPPLLLTGKRRDLIEIRQLLLRDIETQQQARNAGASAAAVATEARARAESLERLALRAIGMLDRIGGTFPTAEDVTALLPFTNHQPDDQPRPAPTPFSHVRQPLNDPTPEQET